MYHMLVAILQLAGDTLSQHAGRPLAATRHQPPTADAARKSAGPCIPMTNSVM
jgi:hypothetical protein